MADDTRALLIVEEALGLDAPDLRKALIADRCGADAGLRARVEQLLALDDAVFRLTPTESFVQPLSVVEAIPDRIGPYRVTGEIARGGMGAVVKAERDDGVFQQTVAIKLIRGDLASERAKARFAEERRILARLRHPGIVRILDGGQADNRPWLAMDYIDGEPVTRALDRMQASQGARLDAFEAVCEAVAHAHRNLVIHADLKPSNVLMTDDGRVHLLDFGIARLIVALDVEEEGDPYPLTKGYAAPERGVGVAPTIASDIFSLGVLMLGMLGCATPSPDMAHVPGTRLPVGQLDGDLAAIAGRALAEEPADRYADVTELLADVRRHRGWVPVKARGDAGWRYLAGRFIRRHRKGLALAGIAGLLLLGVATFSTIQYVRAERARAEADARFDDVRGIAKFMLTDLSDRLDDAPGTVAARARLAEEAGHYLARLSAVPDAPADLRFDTAQGYRRLASLQGLSGTSSLGRPDAARRSLARAAALLAELDRERPGNAAILEERGRVALALWIMAADSASSAQTAQAKRFFAAALAAEPGRPGALLGAVTAERNHGVDLVNADQAAAALPILRSALVKLRAMKIGPELQREAALLEVTLLARMGDATYYAGDKRGALAPYLEAKAIIDTELAHRPSLLWTDKLGEAAFNLSSTIAETGGSPAEALAEARKGSEAMRRTLAFGPDAAIEMRLVILYGEESLLLSQLGRREEAAATSSRGLAMRDARLAVAPNDPTRQRDVAVALANHADLLRAAGHAPDACAAARRGQALLRGMQRRGELAARDARVEIPRLDVAADAACD